jgi:hypothetical protein
VLPIQCHPLLYFIPSVAKFALPSVDPDSERIYHLLGADVRPVAFGIEAKAQGKKMTETWQLGLSEHSIDNCWMKSSNGLKSLICLRQGRRFLDTRKGEYLAQAVCSVIPSTTPV